jgi:glycerol-3-phosphate dehydrogenase (NAD(P)+)
MKIGVIGAGAWGTALAQVMAQGGDVLLWALEEEVVASINTHHVNDHYLPDYPAFTAIRATGDLAEMAECDALLVVTPAQHVRATLERLPDTSAPLILCAKGIEAGSGKLISQVAEEVRPQSPSPSSPARRSRMKLPQDCRQR